MFFDLLLIFLILFYKNCWFFYKYHPKKLIKFIKITDISDFKKSQIVGARIAGAGVIKNCWIIWCTKEYYLESKDNWKRKNLLTEAKLWKKVKAVW